MNPHPPKEAEWSRTELAIVLATLVQQVNGCTGPRRGRNNVSELQFLLRF